MPQHGHFIWADLSSYRPDVTRPFYIATFGWQFSEAGGYATATCDHASVAGLYQMPKTFIDMGMPSFWMSYIQVDDVATTVDLARANGAKVELGPDTFQNGGQFALIRDPLGAGFTVYQGPNMSDVGTASGTRKSHALFVSDAAQVMEFYETLFGWQFRPLSDDSWQIEGSGSAKAHLYQVPDAAIRGKEQYWAVMFNADAETSIRAEAAGGQVIADMDLHDGATQVIADPDGGRFFVQVTSDIAPKVTAKPPIKWKAWVGLALIALSVATGWAWISALFFAIWAALGLRGRATYLLEPISRAEAPVLYWLTLATYAALVPLILIWG